MRCKMPREFYIPKGSVKVADKLSDAVAYLSQYEAHGQTRYRAVCFHGKADKPDSNFYFRSALSRENHVKLMFERRRDRLANKAKRREEAKAFAHNVQVGDIFKTCWGYDQTNVEFFEVIEVRGKHAILREIASASRNNGKGSESCVPQSGSYCGEPLRRLIQDGRIKIDYVRNARPWGTRVAGVVVGEPASRTAAGWGH